MRLGRYRYDGGKLGRLKSNESRTGYGERYPGVFAVRSGLMRAWLWGGGESATPPDEDTEKKPFWFQPWTCS